MKQRLKHGRNHRLRILGVQQRHHGKIFFSPNRQNLRMLASSPCILIFAWIILSLGISMDYFCSTCRTMGVAAFTMAPKIMIPPGIIKTTKGTRYARMAGAHGHRSRLGMAFNAKKTNGDSNSEFIRNGEDTLIQNSSKGSENINGISSSQADDDRLQSRSQSLTPNHILHPLYFPYNATHYKTTFVENSYHDAVQSLSLPLAMQKMMETLQTIINSPSINDLQMRLGGAEDLFIENGDDAASTALPYTIQIVQRVNHPIDTLCWLHANQPRLTAIYGHNYRQRQNDGYSYGMHANVYPPPTFYISKFETTFEAASVGSALSMYDLNEDNWQIIKNLPHGSGVYGGSRFDQNGEISPEWDDFGKEFWMLPAIELRQDQGKEGRDDDTKDNIIDETRTSLMVHLHFTSMEDLLEKARYTLDLLQNLSSGVSAAVPCATLPPVLSRGYNPDAQEIFEKGVNAALEKFQMNSDNVDDNENVRKVVLARRADLNFASEIDGLDIMMKLKFGGDVGGHLFYMNPGGRGNEFLGCSPERLFQVNGKNMLVMSEALAGTRPRGTTSEADAELLRDLMHSEKDRSENVITGQFIEEAFHSLRSRGLLEKKDQSSLDDTEGVFYVRRLRHLQHICQSFEGKMTRRSALVDITRFLLEELQPTPAVCGVPQKQSMEFIRDHESISFDRGMYAGPLGFLGSNSADIIVAIRSALLTKNTSNRNDNSDLPIKSSLSVYAGAGIVPGSTVQGEWSETGYKLGVLSSTFYPTPLTLKSFQTPNEAWATSFVEELIRSGVTQFYICPGSRSTPLTAALARAMRTHIGIIECISTHDERGAAFRALGYARATKRPAAVVTSSGTAVANLYPAVMEAGLDSVPMLLLTADRPYENRDTGANQAVDQIKVFSDTYIRWFRDIAPPSEDIPVSLALSDANHAVSVANEQRGPVHLNIQFRENLAPEAGPIRGDNRVGSVTEFSSNRFTDVPGFQNWSARGRAWSRLYSPSGLSTDSALFDLADLILRSKRGMIVVGNLKSDGIDGGSSESLSLAALISDFAELIGFPIFAGAQTANLRFYSPAVVPFAEHLLKNPNVKRGMEPDLIIQIGSHLVSTEVQGLISSSMKKNPETAHVLLHTSRPGERADPGLTVTHQILSDVEHLIPNLQSHLKRIGVNESSIGSELSPLVKLGRFVSRHIPDIIHTASKEVIYRNSKVWDEKAVKEEITLTEPMILLAMSEVICELKTEESSHLFLSNSMPVRDAEFFLYPTLETFQRHDMKQKSPLLSVNVNRGASGIDGIISSATGFAEASSSPTTLLIGDLATIHDLNAFHNLSRRSTKADQKAPKSSLPFTSIIVNNDGGGIFSFLPIAKHGNDVNFDEFFGTPTNSFSFSKGAEAFGISYSGACSYVDFKTSYERAMALGEPSIVEARVVGREQNVEVHAEITKRITVLIDDFLSSNHIVTELSSENRLPAKFFREDELHEPKSDSSKTLVLLHGWMGEKNDWDRSALSMIQDLSDDWNIISLDLPGHGESPLLCSSDRDLLRATLSIDQERDGIINIEDVASSVMNTLRVTYGITNIDAIAGYSLGGRVALAMKSLSSVDDKGIVSDDTKLFLLGSNPGTFYGRDIQAASQRRASDKVLGDKMLSIHHASSLSYELSSTSSTFRWVNFLSKWYGVESLWANLDQRHPSLFSSMIQNRLDSLKRRAPDLVFILNGCSVGQNPASYWKDVNTQNTYFLSGQLDEKYSDVGKNWKMIANELTHQEIKNVGHALLTEAPIEVAKIITRTLMERNDSTSDIISKSNNVNLERENIKSTEIHQHFTTVTPALFDAEEFSIDLIDDSGKGVNGVGWGEQSKVTKSVNKRRGLVISISSGDGCFIGLGEISPLQGVHPESFEEAKQQVSLIQDILGTPDFSVDAMKCEEVVALDGCLSKYIDGLESALREHYNSPSLKLHPSVYSGLEMALLSLASHALRDPLPKSLLLSHLSRGIKSNSLQLPINGLQTRKMSSNSLGTVNNDNSRRISFPSMKVKVGHRDIEDDARDLIAYRGKDALNRKTGVRADANRSWTDSEALNFVKALKEIDESISDRIEFVEEPIEKTPNTKTWELRDQIEALEHWSERSSLRYALDESLADAALGHEGDFYQFLDKLFHILKSTKGCAALVLKPSLIGIERSMQLSRLAHEDLGIGAVFTSTFDSGIGLAYTAFVASVSDSTITNEEIKYPHGISTFSMMSGDTLTPTFESYVSNDGILNVASLGRAMFGLGIDEMRDYNYTTDEDKGFENGFYAGDEEYQTMSTTSETGRKISIQVSLPLPFSDDVAWSRYTDLPQQPRWSPWIKSVAYLEQGETQWNLNVRGVEFKWKAISKMLDNPKGIMWESTSGLKNKGVVEFVPVSNDSCLMRVKMTVITPRIIALLFKTSDEFVKEFVENKLLKWSLESFRDVVKADLALERGDAELGDALFGAVEGRSNAIEATLSYQGFQDKDS